MSIRERALEEIEDVVFRGLRGIVGIAKRAQAKKEAQPDITALFHRIMSKRLPKWRWAARAWHRSQARRWTAKADASPRNSVAAEACRYKPGA